MHDLEFDPSTREGTAIVRLFNVIKDDIENRDGSWDGGHVVDWLTEWFGRLGIDVNADAITTETPLLSNQPAKTKQPSAN